MIVGSVEPPAIVAIAGGSGAGKTTMVRRLASLLGDDLVVIEQDSYYLDQSDRDPKARRSLNFDHPDALDLVQLVADLTALVRGRAVDVPSYDFTTHTRRGGARHVEPHRFIAVEGTLVLHSPDVCRLAAVRVYLDADPEIRLGRRIERDGRERGRSADDVRAQYAATVAPMHERFVAPQRSRADLVIDTDEDHALGAGVDALLARLRSARAHGGVPRAVVERT